jgi:hypothetical protein
MSNLPSNATFKLFIEIHKAYGPNQHSKDIKVKEHTLDLKVIMLKQHILEVTLVKEETQELPKHKFDLTIRDTIKIGRKAIIKCTSRNVCDKSTLELKV